MLIFCQWPRRWALSAAHGRWFGRLQLASILGTVETFSLRLRSENNRHRVCESRQSLLSGFDAGPPLRRGAVQSPPLRLSKGALQGMSLILYWVHIGRHIWLRACHTTRHGNVLDTSGNGECDT